MNEKLDQSFSLPVVKGDLKVFYLSSLATAGLMALASFAGLFRPQVVYPTAELVQAFQPNDLVNLALGVPILLLVLYFSWRGKLWGLLCWPGALLFVLYNYIAYTFGLPVSWVFFLHLGLAILSGYTLVGLLGRLNGRAILHRLSGRVPEKFGGGILAGLGLLSILRDVGVLAGALLQATPISQADLGVLVADFVITPLWILGGIQLLRGRRFGYLAGLGLLFQASLLFVGLIAFLLLQPVLTAAPLAVMDILVVAGMGLVCFVPWALFLLAALRADRG